LLKHILVDDIHGQRKLFESVTECLAHGDAPSL
jgi:hypothetical protein